MSEDTNFSPRHVAFILVALINHRRLPSLRNSYVGSEKNTLLFHVLNLLALPPSLAGMQTLLAGHAYKLAS
jgi:hypothetical protein